jgi:hypothetical protein
VAICEDQALLAISVYIDLNPVVAKIAATPKTSAYTSMIKQRVDRVEEEGKTIQLEVLTWPAISGVQAVPR